MLQQSMDYCFGIFYNVLQIANLYTNLGFSYHKVASASHHLDEGE